MKLLLAAASMKSIILPRKHLSWSAIDLWQKDPREYQRVYFLGEERFTNAAMQYGSKFAHAMETGEATDPVIATAALLVPRYDVSEYKLSAELKTEEGKIPLLGFLDTSHSDPADGFREYKTGSQPWTQRRVDNHGQLTLYALMVYLKHHRQVQRMHLDWLPTEKTDGRIVLTGEIRSFSTERSMTDILAMAALVRRTAYEISAAYTRHLDSFFT